MTYSQENWRHAFLTVMLKDPNKKWEREDLFLAAGQWLLDNKIPEENSK